MPSPSSNDNEPGLVSQEWLTQKRLELERSRLKASSSSTANSNPVPSSFVAFAKDWLHIELTPAQTVLCKVAFDGAEPGELVAEERDLARELFGDVEVVPALARVIIAVIIGGRAGKTYLFALRVLHLGLIVDLRGLAPGEQGVGLIMAPDLELAGQALNYVRGAVEANPTLNSWVTSITTEWVELRRYDGNVISVRCRAASRGGKTGRGKSLFAALLDEACFFRDANYSVNDDEMYKAVAPRIMEGGQLLIPSTPWTEAGLLYEMWKANLGNPAYALAAHAPTLLMCRKADGSYVGGMDARVDRERQRDPDNARREFDAEPMGGGAVHFFDPAALAACIDEAQPAVSVRTSPFEPAWMGLDTGFRKNPSGGVVVRLKSDRILLVAECAEIAPPKGGRLVPSETMRALMDRAKFHHVSQVVADQHYIETVREHIGMLTLVEAPSVPADAYIVARDAIAEGRVRISAQHQRLLSQLREVVSKPTSGGNISISSPTRGTAHGDVASAFVLAIWKAVIMGAVNGVKGTAVRSAMTRALDANDGAGERRQSVAERGGPRRVGKVWE